MSTGILTNFFAVVLYAFIFFFNTTATTKIYTLSLHDALPIYIFNLVAGLKGHLQAAGGEHRKGFHPLDRKSTRLNSSHQIISYAVFCLKKKITKPSVNALPN